ncbi:hypothetical protein E1293_40940 [Actinomadura darangshiensis]|uniref:Putative zinc-finger domain-containing protein n=1 Tax=Actinomadura darangshiensis TaxID=705336 RepID=A0A4R5A1U3_9ACTN|nr:hypothetical protein [Actinomadura darangshiensis]TDD64920.1 hypothetical protein E1293_40940 [Actinomadura darangshiensis]
MGGTDCGEYRAGLGVYAIGRLAGTEADELSAHLVGCPPCRAELAELRDVAELLAHSARQLSGAFQQRAVQKQANRALQNQPLQNQPVQNQPVQNQPVQKQEGAGRRPRTGASRMNLSGACAYGATGPGRSR